MAYRAAYHFEHGEDHPGLTNTATFPPATDEVTTVGAIGGAYSRHLDFASNDTFVVSLLSGFTSDTAADSMCVAMAVKIDDPVELTYLQLAVERKESVSDSAVGAVVYPDGSIQIRRYSSPGSSLNSSGTLLASAPAGTFTFGVRQFLSLRVLVDNSAGEVQLEVNGVEVVNETGIDTRHGSNTELAQWGTYLLIDADDGDVYLDDWVIADNLASPIPNMVHEALVPDGVTADNDGTPTGAATNWEACDETPQDGGTTYSTIPVGKQGFTFTDRTETGDPVYVQHMAAIGDPAVGSEVVNGFVSDGTEVDGSQISLSTDFTSKPVSDILETPPSGGSWDTTAINGLTAGVERAS